MKEKMEKKNDIDGLERQATNYFVKDLVCFSLFANTKPTLYAERFLSWSCASHLLETSESISYVYRSTLVTPETIAYLSWQAEWCFRSRSDDTDEFCILLLMLDLSEWERARKIIWGWGKNRLKELKYNASVMRSRILMSGSSVIFCSKKFLKNLLVALDKRVNDRNSNSITFVLHIAKSSNNNNDSKILNDITNLKVQMTSKLERKLIKNYNP